MKMRSEGYGLKKLVVSSFDIQFTTNLGELAKTIRTSKKCLRKAYLIRRKESFECEIMEKRKLVKRTFQYGFRRFKKKEEHKDREILAPHPDVQLAFKAIKEWLDRVSSSHKRAYGFVKKRNPKKAVKTLLGNKHFFRFDIADAFPSIGMEMVQLALKGLKIDETLMMPLSWFITYYYDGQRRLPQGSACSPAMLNRIYKPMCNRIQQVCEKHNIKKFIVYADDFTFASDLISEEAKKELLAVPVSFGFEINEKKTRNFVNIVPHVLGLTIVRGEIHLNHRRKNKFRRILYAATKGNYSHKHVMGIVAAIRQIYGEERNWPGWLLKPWQKYQLKREVIIWKGTDTNCRPKTLKQNRRLSLAP